MPGLLIILGMAGFILLLPILLPVVAFLEARDRRRRKRAAQSFACVTCGQTLGPAALELADAAWAQHFAALCHALPHATLRIVRDVWAVCPKCGERYGYDESTRGFVALPPS